MSCKFIINNNYMPHQSIVLTNKKTLKDFSYKKITVAYQMRNSSNCLGHDSAIWELEVHPTNLCNLNCKGCSYGTRHNKRTLSIERIHEFLNSINSYDLKSIFFSGGGDPLLWPYWEKFFNTIDKPCNYGISTNLYNFNSIKSFWKQFDFYQIHITGFDKKSSYEFTGIDSFGRINDNISFVLKNKLPTQTITLKWMINEQNHNELKRFLDYAMDKSVDSIIIKFQQNFLKNYDYAKNETIGKIREIAYSHEILSNYNFLLDNLDDTIFNAFPHPTTCIFANSGLYKLINAEGDIYPCIASNSNRENRLNKERCTKDIYSENMNNGKCPLKACRHYRFNQYLSCTYNDHIENAAEYIPVLL